jgi:hypothetical protein
MEYICFYFAIGVQNGDSIGGVLQCSKKSVDGPMNTALSKMKKKL